VTSVSSSRTEVPRCRAWSAADDRRSVIHPNRWPPAALTLACRGTEWSGSSVLVADPGQVRERAEKTRRCPWPGSAPRSPRSGEWWRTCSAATFRRTDPRGIDVSFVRTHNGAASAICVCSIGDDGQTSFVWRIDDDISVTPDTVRAAEGAIRSAARPAIGHSGGREAMPTTG
jgi:hypothetical protein